MMLAAAPMAARPLRRHGVHGGDDDLRRLAGVRRAAEPDHEGEPVPAPRQRLLPASTARPSPSRAIWSSPGSCARAGAASASNLDDDGRHRRQRRGRAVSAGDAPRRGDDAGRARRGSRTRAAGGSAEAVRRAAAAAASRSASRWSTQDVPRGDAQSCCSGHFVSDELADGLDRHYVLDAAGDDREARSRPNRRSTKCWPPWRHAAPAAQKIGALRARAVRRHCSSCTASITSVPLFLASFAGFAVRAAGHRRDSEDARAGAARSEATSTPSTTFCFRCFCRSRC